MDIRFFNVDTASLAIELISLIGDALRAAGRGSAIATTDGVQVTADSELMPAITRIVSRHLEARAELLPTVVFGPSLALPTDAAITPEVLSASRILPPDMRCTEVHTGQFKAFVFSGYESRRKYFEEIVFEQVKQAVYGTSIISYHPGVGLPSSSGVTEFIERLALCPPDMRYVIIPRESCEIVLFSGPLDRQSHYQSIVLPALRRLCGVLETPISHGGS